MKTTDELIDHYREHGWAPAPQDHLPAEIRTALKAMRLEPRIKEWCSCRMS